MPKWSASISVAWEWNINAISQSLFANHKIDYTIDYTQWFYHNDYKYDCNTVNTQVIKVGSVIPEEAIACESKDDAPGETKEPGAGDAEAGTEPAESWDGEPEVACASQPDEACSGDPDESCTGDPDEACIGESDEACTWGLEAGAGEVAKFCADEEPAAGVSVANNGKPEELCADEPEEVTTNEAKSENGEAEDIIETESE